MNSIPDDPSPVDVETRQMVIANSRLGDESPAYGHFESLEEMRKAKERAPEEKDDEAEE